MRIAIFLHDVSGGGAEKVMVEFVNYLIQQKTPDDITLILTRKFGSYLDVIDPRVKVVSLEKSGALNSVVPLYKYLKHHPVDVLYSTLRNANLISILIGKMLSIRVIIREASTIKEYNKTKKSLTKRVSISFVKYAYKYCYKCIAISKRIERDLLAFTNIPESSIRVIYNPILVVDTISSIRFENGYFNVVMVSRLVSLKNILTICSVIEDLREKNYKVKLHVFGDGPEKIHFESLIRRYPDSVELYGFELSYYSYMKYMQLFIHIPHWEGLGNSVLEVFNTGIPMVLSDVEAGYAELVKKTYANVHYFEPLNSTGMISLIEGYITGSHVVANNRELISLPRNDVFEQYRKLANFDNNK